MKSLLVALLPLSLFGCAARHGTPAPPERPHFFAEAVQTFLDRKGGYCLGKPDWPRIVTEVDRRKRRPDALQMPVLEHLGVVSRASAPGDSTNARYSLTDAGRKFYVAYPPRGDAPADETGGRRGDLCVAQLRVKKVTKWTQVQFADAVATTTVSYTYQVASAAPWTGDPDFRRVFPVVAEVLTGANHLEMMLPLRWTGHAWVAAVQAY